MHLGNRVLSSYFWSMNEIKYRWLLYFISGVILATLCIQVYWNYKNYEIGKQQLVNDVQVSLDNAVDSYYTGLAKEKTFSFIADSTISDSVIMENITGEFILKSPRIEFDTIDNIVGGKHSLIDTSLKRLSISKSKKRDSISIEINDSIPLDLRNKLTTETGIIAKSLENLTSKIVVSFSEDSLSLAIIDSLVSEELLRKNIDIDYGLTYQNFYQNEQELRSNIIDRSSLKTTTVSPFFLHESALTIHFGNITLPVLKKNLVGILLSFLLLGSIIFCLLYLLKIIKEQKQLAEVKNDLISNITHEFKTPIATIGAAMEGIQVFNNENNIEKTQRYAKISREQVEKLNGMVEKLLETATLDSERLSLNFENHNLVELLRIASHKEEFSTLDKIIDFTTSDEEIICSIDIFHFENAINNIIDNAIKYGGEAISVAVKKVESEIEITISDTGQSLNEIHKKQIFEKFYRVPKGNTHDVKGFGIGLYYSKKIIEKHMGSISLELNGFTTFKIVLPYEH